ncbi:MAG: UDP-4-amino-4,6-dideoxy-N-acetyl-beta-L-altrosamine transaminase [Alphaproteobacteria bacterium]|nr:UDP-4-amino-4,6-dideoxy-N-acetyl-beta-L-altrosamine transaminase [Alphaproteobacteria bacterium]
MTVTLPYGRQLIEDDDIAAVVGALKGDFLTTGPIVAEFETALARKVNAARASACSSGTAALHLAMMALDVVTGDTVIVPSITFVATANMVRATGAEVVFADVDAETGLLGAVQLEDAIRRAKQQFPDHRLRAAIPVHLTGQTCAMEEIHEVASRHGLALVEDACHALGTSNSTTDGEVMVGSCRWSDIACFSFHPVKAIAMGEGGAITSANPAYIEAANRHRNHGLIRRPDAFEYNEDGFSPDGKPNPWYYEMPEFGYNYRVSDILCALGISQIRKLDRFVARRQTLVDRYRKLLPPLSNRVLPVPQMPNCNSAWHLFCVRIDFAELGLQRGEVIRRLLARGIGSQVHYIPVHRQPYYRRRYGDQSLPGSVAYYDRTLSLPLFVGMSDTDVDHVVNTLSDILPTA